MPFDPWDTAWPCEVPVREGRGRRRMLRAWPESGRVAVECGRDGTAVYVDLAHTGELISLLSASSYRAAVLVTEPRVPDTDGPGDKRV